MPFDVDTAKQAIHVQEQYFLWRVAQREIVAGNRGIATDNKITIAVKRYGRTDSETWWLPDSVGRALDAAYSKHVDDMVASLRRRAAQLDFVLKEPVA